MQILNDEGQRVLNILDSNFKDYQKQSEECFERLRKIEREKLPEIQRRTMEVEVKSKLLEEQVDKISPSQ